MHDGVLPGTFTANTMTRMPITKYGTSDMKKQNKKTARTSFADWLQQRHIELSAEEEEAKWTDEEELEDDEWEYDGEEEPEDDEDFDELEYNDENGDDEEDDEFENPEDADPEEFDDFDEEKELDFDDENHEFPLPGRFKDFYRMQGEEEQEANLPDAPGGFEPGQAVGTASAMGSNVTKKDKARAIMRQIANKPGMDRDTIIQELIRQLPTTEETATSYYEDIAKEMGLMGNSGEEDPMAGAGDMGEEPVDQLPGDQEMEMSQEEIDAQDPNAQGIIRTVDKAHLVYKRQQEDGKFEELWVYNIGDNLHDSLGVRREILQGTDIPRGHTKSENGHQSYTLQTMGNAQLLHITGLAN